jgi:hypothetical protein
MQTSFEIAVSENTFFESAEQFVVRGGKHEFPGFWISHQGPTLVFTQRLLCGQVLVILS